VVITTQNEKPAQLVKRHPSSHMPDCINKEASISFGYTHTCSSEHKSGAAVGEEEERERGALIGEDFLYLFELSLGIVLAIYIKEVFVGFSPP
jgi:hypothetical protein